MADVEIVAGNGLLHRRAFLTGGAALAAAFTGYTLSDSVAVQQLADDSWSTKPGVPIPEYGVPSSFEKPVARILSNPKGEPRTQHARTPHHLLNGTFTPMNKIIGENDVMNAQTLPKVRMPNRDGFIARFPERMPQ
jgi:sulfane dehydrogenase subunit SoxC